jgi:Aspartyl protease
MPRHGRYARRLTELALLLAAFTARAATPVPEPAAPAVPEIVVEAPEPRYVSPTRHDRIGRIWAPVYINDQGPFRLVLDTGANSSAITAAVAATLGIPLPAEDSVLLRGVTGARRVQAIAVQSFVVGDLELRSKTLPIVSDAFGGAQGVLGTEGLQDKRIVIDFRHDRISIMRSHGERAEAGFVTVPVRIVGGLLLVADVRMGGITAKAIIDTGGQGTLANEALREALKRRIRSEDVMADEVVGATLDVEHGDRLRIPPMMLGALEIRAAHVTIGDMYIFQCWKMVQEPALLIGMDVLGLLDTLIIDYRRHELQIRPRRAFD